MGLDISRSVLSPLQPRDTPEVSLIVPVYNEAGPGRADAFRAMLDASLTLLDTELPGRHQVLVIDDGSTDSSRAIAQEFGINPLSHPDRQNHGKGATVRLGMLAAQGARRVFADADGSYTPHTILRLADTIGGAADIAVAYRASDRGHASSVRSAGHTLLERVCDVIAPTDSIDTQAGAKAFTAEAAEVIWSQVRASGYGADREAMHLARRMGYRVANVPAEVTVVTGSHVRPLRDGALLIADTLRTRINAGS
jgi:glycosyltransferase involved in cell wall biosynthesis